MEMTVDEVDSNAGTALERVKNSEHSNHKIFEQNKNYSKSIMKGVTGTDSGMI